MILIECPLSVLPFWLLAPPPLPRNYVQLLVCVIRAIPRITGSAVCQHCNHYRKYVQLLVCDIRVIPSHHRFCGVSALQSLQEICPVACVIRVIPRITVSAVCQHCKSNAKDIPCFQIFSLH